MFFLNGKNEKITIPEKGFQEGGQAIIHFPLTHPGVVVKVYKQKPPHAEIEKIRYMIAHPPDDPCQVDGHISYAWPSDLAFDVSKNVVGYLMPRVQKSLAVLDVFNPHRRKMLKLSLDWRFLHGVAANLASAIASLHEKNYVIGDINEGNVLVNNRALVTLIDVDSFQVTVGQKVFACPVGKEEYTPREVLAKGFGERRESCSDGFGLAVLIYQLLLEGSHPFRGVWKGSGDPPPVGDKIRQGYFPYLSGSPNQPLTALRPAFGDLLPEVQQCFLRAFVDGHRDPRLRPSALEWQKTLRLALKELRQCAANGAHFYFRHSPNCPWCYRKGPAPAVQTVRQPQRQEPAQAKPNVAQPAPAGKPAASAPPQKKPRATTRSSAGKAKAPAGAAANSLLLSKTLLDFGIRFAGVGRGNWRKLTLSNPTQQPMTVVLSSGEGWIGFSEERFVIAAGQTKELRVKLLLDQLSVGLGEKRGTVLVRYQDGNRVIALPVRVNVQAPTVRLSTETCVFTATYLYQKMMQEIQVTNQGHSKLALTFRVKEKWIKIAPAKINLESGKSQALQVIVSPADVPVKHRQDLQVGKIQIKGPGSYQKSIVVGLRMKP